MTRIPLAALWDLQLSKRGQVPSATDRRACVSAGERGAASGLDLRSVERWEAVLSYPPDGQNPTLISISISHPHSGCGNQGALAESPSNSEPTRPEWSDMAEFRGQAPAGARSGAVSTLLREGRYDLEDLRRLARMRGVTL